MKSSWFVLYTLLLLCGLGMAAPSHYIPPPPVNNNRTTNAVLWQLGKMDDSSAELADYKRASAQLNVPGDWQARVDWTALPKGLKADINPSLNIHYQLARLPRNGVWLSFKLLHSDKAGAQMAVFSNRLMAGLIQLWGTGGTNSSYHWQKTYQLYIPKELLVRGDNVLRLEATRPAWSDAASNASTWWEWDYLKLEALGAPAQEPLHGKMTYLGTTLKQSGNDFRIDARTLAIAPTTFKWMGIAYSGNTIRADYWYDVGNQQPNRLEYLQMLRDLNMSVCVDHISSYHFGLDPNGQMPPSTKDDLKTFFDKYSSYFQYYELENEPTGFAGPHKWGGTHAAIMQLANYINSIKPAHVKTVAPGWAYWDKGGTPNGWEADPVMRRQIEDLCQATNGHSYGFSYTQDRGGSFIENLKTYGGVTDGWPKEYINSTCYRSRHSMENASRKQTTLSTKPCGVTA
ncbi:MAG: hypothetical protein JO316_13600 [Abitibacteriaceae bacterium]|nr:hypothetical protein [Abditibacteriaceae bacterium]